MIKYQDLLRLILDQGTKKGDRTGTGTISLFGPQLFFNLQEGFPLITTKKMWWKGIVKELLWMISGSTDNTELMKEGVSIWKGWASEEGNLGPVYGHQWRNFMGSYIAKDGTDYTYFKQKDAHYGKKTELEGFDQLKWAIDRIKSHPDCRRIIVTGWNPLEIDDMGLPPCHCFYQFNVAGGKLHCKMYQRSADVFLGVTFNIASYALLTMMVAKETGLKPGNFIHTFGDVHIYNNHIDQVLEQLERKPYPLPQVRFADKSMFDMEYEDIKLEGYECHPPIKAEVSI